MTHKTLLLGKGSEKYIQKAIQSLKNNGNIHVILKKDSLNMLTSHLYFTSSFGRSFRWFNIFLLMTFLVLRLEKVIIV